MKTYAADARSSSMVELAFFGGPNHFFSRFPGSRIGTTGDTFSCLRHNGSFSPGLPAHSDRIAQDLHLIPSYNGAERPEALKNILLKYYIKGLCCLQAVFMKKKPKARPPDRSFGFFFVSLISGKTERRCIPDRSGRRSCFRPW